MFGFECSDGYFFTAPEGSFAANGSGLQDMLGNASEWTQDCWHDNYKGAPADGSAWTRDGDCTRRVLRGGSWFDEPAFLTTTFRIMDAPANRYIFTGFRLA